LPASTISLPLSTPTGDKKHDLLPFVSPASLLTDHDVNPIYGVPRVRSFISHIRVFFQQSRQ